MKEGMEVVPEHKSMIRMDHEEVEGT